MLVGVTNSSREILMVNPLTKVSECWGQTKIGTFKWTGGCEYKGKCFGFPRKENCILEINTRDRLLREIPLNIHYRGEHHYGGVATPEGVVYQPPRDTDHVLKIDLNTFEVKKIPIPGSKKCYRYSASVLHPNGDIYMVPEVGFRPLLLHPDDDSIELFGETSDHLVFGAVVGIDQCIYGFPKAGIGILKINPFTQCISYICEDIGVPDCYGSVIGVNGKIYGVPAEGISIWEFDVNSQMARRLFIVEEGYAKCAGGGIGSNGTIVMMPCFGSTIYFLEPDGIVRSSENAMKNIFLNSAY